MAWLYYRTAVQLCAGPGLALMGGVGLAAASPSAPSGPSLLLALPGVFYIWSMHSSGTPIFMPGAAAVHLLQHPLRPGGAAAAGLGAAALVAWPPRLRARWWRALVVAAGTCHWVLHPQPANWVTWEESRVNSEARRAWTRQAAGVPGAPLPARFRYHDIVRRSGGHLPQAGIPLRETFTGDNGLPWLAAVRRPEFSCGRNGRWRWPETPVEAAIDRGACRRASTVWKRPSW